jgi:tRNA threonylcarbamoyladenosine biosynthesis protein TsaB
MRLGEVALTSPENIVLDDIEFVAGSAINEYGDRLFARSKNVFLKTQLDPESGVSALGVLACAKVSWCAGLAQDIHQLEPVYVRNKVAFTAEERKQANI